MPFRTTVLLVAGAVAAVLSVRATTAEPTATDLARAVQHKYEAVHDFSADFAQERTSVLRKRLTERGKVSVKKPGKMRWEYRSPEEKLFISDGVNSYMYVTRDRQVFISPVPSGNQASTPILFLAGKGDLTRDFTSSLTDPAAGMPPGTQTLKLTPKAPQPEYDWLTLSVDATTLALRGLAAMDPQGGLSTFTFTNLKENVGLADQLFVFKPPRGVDIVTDLSQH